MALRGTGSLWMSNMPKSRSRKSEDPRDPPHITNIDVLEGYGKSIRQHDKGKEMAIQRVEGTVKNVGRLPQKRRKGK